MDPQTIAALGQGVGAVTALIGDYLAKGDEARAMELYRKAAAQFGPEFEKEVQVDPVVSEWANAQEDAPAKDAQARILSQLEDEYSSGGMSAGDQAAMTLARQTGDAEASSANATIQQSLAQRGGSGQINAYLQQGAAQDAANRTGNAALQEQAAARDRALRALEAGGGLAGQMRGASAAFTGARANGLDDLNQFNTHMSFDAQQQNNDNGFRERGAKEGAMDNYAESYQRRANGTRRTAAAIGNAASGASAYPGGKK